MAQTASRKSYAAGAPDLYARLPLALRGATSPKEAFDHARDPMISAQLKDMQKTESQRRGEQGRDSLMVKLQKPMPSMRPKSHEVVTRTHFNAQWLHEARAARMAQYQMQSEALPANAPTPPQRTPGMSAR